MKTNLKKGMRLLVHLVGCVFLAAASTCSSDDKSNSPSKFISGVEAERYAGGDGIPQTISTGGVTLTVNHSSWVGWATYDIQYFKVECEQNGNDCSQNVSWSTNYGWFEPLKTGGDRSIMDLAPVAQRSTSTTGEIALWSSDMDYYLDAAGAIELNYGAATLTIPVTAYNATNSEEDPNPLPEGYFRYAITPVMDYRDLRNWTNDRPLEDLAYQQDQLTTARQISERLRLYIADWLAGNAPAEIPDDLMVTHLTPQSMSSDRLRWRLVRFEDIDQKVMQDFHSIRPARYDFDVQSEGVRGLFPDENATYFRSDYVAPFGSTLVVSGKFPHARFFAVQDSEPFDPRYPAGVAGGAPEVPILDVDIIPDPGSVNPYQVGANRRATNRNYTVRFEHSMDQIDNYREGQMVLLNEENCPGSMTETGPGPAYRCIHPQNKRIAGPIRAGGGVTLGELLPAQLWIRYYAPDRNKGALGGVPLPKVHLEMDVDDDGDIDKFMIVPRRFPDVAGEGRDIALRRVHARFKYEQYENGLAPLDTAWTKNTGWTKMFGIPRNLLSRISIDSGFPTRRKIRDLDEGVAGRGHDAELTGGLETTATGCTNINYTIRPTIVEPGHIVVLTGKKPITPKTRNGEKFMTGGDLRYFSLTRYHDFPLPETLAGGVVKGAALDSIMDDEILADENGWYTMVFSRPEDRPENAIAANDITWRSWSPISNQRFVARWMTVGGLNGEEGWEAPSWAPDIHNVPYATGDWAQPKWKFDEALTFTNDRSVAAMGDYHIELHYFTTEEFENLGMGINPQTLPRGTGW